MHAYFLHLAWYENETNEKFLSILNAFNAFSPNKQTRV